MTESTQSSHQESGAPRRGFLYQFITGAIAAVLGIVPAVTAVLFALNPLKKTPGGNEGAEDLSDGFVNLGITVEALPEDGAPRAVKVVDDRVDAWNKFTNVEIGRVWLRRLEGDKVVAFSTICPHLGCAIDFRREEHDFYCPCHTSTFALDGTKQNQIPPRNMDELEIRRDEETGELWVKYETYRAATPEKVPV